MFVWAWALVWDQYWIDSDAQISSTSLKCTNALVLDIKFEVTWYSHLSFFEHFLTKHFCEHNGLEYLRLVFYFTYMNDICRKDVLSMSTQSIYKRNLKIVLFVCHHFLRQTIMSLQIFWFHFDCLTEHECLRCFRNNIKFKRDDKFKWQQMWFYYFSITLKNKSSSIYGDWWT